jgi:hypothetical protein
MGFFPELPTIRSKLSETTLKRVRSPHFRALTPLQKLKPGLERNHSWRAVAA